MKQKVKSYGFWVGILSGIGLIVKEILDAAGIVIDQTLIDQIISVVLAVACVTGVVAPAKDGEARGSSLSEQAAGDEEQMECAVGELDESESAEEKKAGTDVA